MLLYFYYMFVVYFRDSDEFCLLKDRRFMVGERELLQLLRRSTCQQCEGKIDPSTIHEGEYIAAGIKYKFKCSVSYTYRIHIVCCDL